jgi:hypothetical protein
MTRERSAFDEPRARGRFVPAVEAAPVPEEDERVPTVVRVMARPGFDAAILFSFVGTFVGKTKGNLVKI